MALTGQLVDGSVPAVVNPERFTIEYICDGCSRYFRDTPSLLRLVAGTVVKASEPCLAALDGDDEEIVVVAVGDLHFLGHSKFFDDGRDRIRVAADDNRLACVVVEDRLHERIHLGRIGDGQPDSDGFRQVTNGLPGSLVLARMNRVDGRRAKCSAEGRSSRNAGTRQARIRVLAGRSFQFCKFQSACCKLSFL